MGSLIHTTHRRSVGGGACPHGALPPKGDSHSGDPSTPGDSHHRLPGNSHALFGVVLLLATALALGAAPRLLVRGDQAAWAEVQAALVKLQRLSTYRARTAVLGRPTTVEVVNPDRYRIKIVGTSTIETVIVGTETRMRVSGGDWRCLSLPNVLPDTSPEKWVGDVTVSKGSTAAVEGIRTQIYTYTLHIRGGSGTFRLYVDLATGLPKRLQALEIKEDEPETVKAQFDYYDYNAPITIELPSCR